MIYFFFKCKMNLKYKSSIIEDFELRTELKRFIVIVKSRLDVYDVEW